MESRLKELLEDAAAQSGMSNDDLAEARSNFFQAINALQAAKRQLAHDQIIWNALKAAQDIYRIELSKNHLLVLK